MPIQTQPAACWRLVDPDGKDYPEDPGAAHHDTKVEAETAPKLYDDDPPLTAVPFGRPCVMVICDGCGADPEDDEWGGHIHFPDEKTAVDMASIYDYVVAGKTVWCDDCVHQPHTPVVGPHGGACDRCGGAEGEHDFALTALR